MIKFYYIAPVILMILCLFSLWSKPHYFAGAVVLISQSVSFLIDDKVSTLYSESNLYGGFGVVVLSAIVSFIYLNLYDREKHKTLFKMGLVSLVFTILHFFYVTGYIVDKNAFSGFIAIQYENIQFILYLYMISLFGWSGIMGIYHGVIRVFNLIGERQASSINHGMCRDNRRVSSDVGAQGRSGTFKEDR